MPQLKGWDCHIEKKTKTTQLYTACKKLYFKYKDINRLKVKGWKMIYSADISHNKTKMTMLISKYISE